MSDDDIPTPRGPAGERIAGLEARVHGLMRRADVAAQERAGLGQDTATIREHNAAQDKIVEQMIRSSTELARTVEALGTDTRELSTLIGKMQDRQQAFERECLTRDEVAWVKQHKRQVEREEASAGRFRFERAIRRPEFWAAVILAVCGVASFVLGYLLPFIHHGA